MFKYCSWTRDISPCWINQRIDFFDKTIHCRSDCIKYYSIINNGTKCNRSLRWSIRGESHPGGVHNIFGRVDVIFGLLHWGWLISQSLLSHTSKAQNNIFFFLSRVEKYRTVLMWSFMTTSDCRKMDEFHLNWIWSIHDLLYSRQHCLRLWIYLHGFVVNCSTINSW